MASPSAGWAKDDDFLAAMSARTYHGPRPHQTPHARQRAARRALLRDGHVVAVLAFGVDAGATVDHLEVARF